MVSTAWACGPRDSPWVRQKFRKRNSAGPQYFPGNRDLHLVEEAMTTRPIPSKDLLVVRKAQLKGISYLFQSRTWIWIDFSRFFRGSLGEQAEVSRGTGSTFWPHRATQHAGRLEGSNLLSNYDLLARVICQSLNLTFYSQRSESQLHTFDCIGAFPFLSSEHCSFLLVYLEDS